MVREGKKWGKAYGKRGGRFEFEKQMFFDIQSQPAADEPVYGGGCGCTAGEKESVVSVYVCV